MADAFRPALDCGTAIAGMAPLLAPGAIVMLGEIHGTVEIPAFVGDLARQAIARGHRVELGLEYPASEQAALVHIPAHREHPFWPNVNTGSG